MAFGLDMNRRRVRFSIALLIIFHGLSLWGDTSLETFIAEQGFEYRFDPFRDLGILKKGYTSVVFSLDVPFFIVDYTLGFKSRPMFRNADGSITVPGETAEVLQHIFNKSAEDADNFSIAAIVIDPGHGGKDPGTIGTHYDNGAKLSLKEKDLVLSVSQMLFDKLSQRYPQKQIKMTRSTDVYLELEERTEIANSIHLEKMEAMIFVSVHANASLNSRASGFEVWYLPPDYRRDLIKPDSLDADKKDLAPILNTVLEEEFTVESIILAQRILNGMDTALKGKSDNRGLKEESWFVVRNAMMPSVLIEIGFVTNKEEAQLLARQDYLIRLTDGIYNGLTDYIDTFDTTKGFTN